MNYNKGVKYSKKYDKIKVHVNFGLVYISWINTQIVYIIGPFDGPLIKICLTKK